MELSVKQDKNFKVISFGNDTDTAKNLQNIVFLKFEVKINEKISMGDKLLSVETMKNNAVLQSPLGGVVSELNSEAEKHPEILKKEPGIWLVKVRK
jgi:glycine cleavage system H lipoate-binding protein